MPRATSLKATRTDTAAEAVRQAILGYYAAKRAMMDRIWLAVQNREPESVTFHGPFRDACTEVTRAIIRYAHPDHPEAAHEPEKKHWPTYGVLVGRAGYVIQSDRKLVGPVSPEPGTLIESEHPVTTFYEYPIPPVELVDLTWGTGARPQSRTRPKPATSSPTRSRATASSRTKKQAKAAAKV